MQRAGQHTDRGDGRVAQCGGGRRHPDLRGPSAADQSVMSGPLFDDEDGRPEGRLLPTEGGSGSEAGEGRWSRRQSLDPGTPLAERMRPRTLDEVLGQDAILAPGKPLREAIE